MVCELDLALARLPRTVVFYDTETSGLNASFDQILQIAAIKTNRSFEIASTSTRTLMLRAKLQPWIVPSPAALLVTRTSPQQLAGGDLHHAMMQKVEKFFSSPAMAIGYNSIRFDEQHLRGAFYRSLCNPFTTQLRGSTRADLMRIAQGIAALDPSAICVPTTSENKPTFRLGGLCRANGVKFPEDDAHDALNDVRATIGLASNLQRATPKVFDRLLALADKTYAEGILEPGAAVLRLRTIGGRPTVRAYGVLDPVKGDSNARLCVDLTIDPSAYLGLDKDGLRAWMKRRPSPVAVLRVNAHEIVFAVNDEVVESLGSYSEADASCSLPADANMLANRAAQLCLEDVFLARIQSMIAEKRAAITASPHIEARLYSAGLPTRESIEEARSLTRAAPAARAFGSSLLLDARLREIALRTCYEEDPASLDSPTRARLDAWRRDRLFGPADAPYRTIVAARLEAATLMETVGGEEAARLREIIAWLDLLEADAASLS